MLWPSIRRWKFQRRGQPGEGAAALGPQLLGPDAAQPVHHAAQHREQQRLEGRHGRGEKGQPEDLAAQAFRAGPQEGEEALGRQRRLGRRIGRQQFFEEAEQEPEPPGGGETLAA